MGMMTMGSAHAQLTDQFSPDLNRALFHSRLDQAQKDMLAIDGRADSLMTVYPSHEMNEQLQYLVHLRDIIYTECARLVMLQLRVK